MDGKRLKQLRTNAGLSLQGLANETGISMKSIDRYERGEASPSSEYVIILADYFNVSADYLLGLVEDTSSYQNADLSAIERRLLEAIRKGENERAFLLLADLVRAGV